ncbi:aldolase [Gordonia oryzae]|uniref:Aldolase n=1 Tax=Gordonia oryzae TaxID=2487349 RepID=A0A3N4G8Z2_9ACTN|nr:aldolase/citrate lyase family protein [Gordonia oryzae]RPA57827.1 aldolase [Gordonia oryzae]
MTEPTSAARSISDHARARIEELLAPVDDDLGRWFPGDRAEPQPVHTVYVSAADVDVDTPRRWGTAALALESSAPTVADLAGDEVREIVRTRLAVNPIEDLRIDLEDGYGWRGDEREDADARRAGQILTRWVADRPHAPRAAGVRAKGLGAYERARGIRTLELVLDGAGGVPSGFVVTVPKLRDVRQVDAITVLCEEFERAHGLTEASVRVELQIEIPQAVLGPDGRATLAQAIHRGGRRIWGLHYGTYDYSAACGIVSAQQSLEHPVADHAKAVMQVAAAQTGVWISDGSTQVMPTGEPEQIDAALRRHHRLVTRSLERGFYQGWDMHPGHLVTRWLAVVGFYRSAMPAAASRLQAYFERRSGDVVDEPATAMSLALVIRRGLAAAAFTVDEVTRTAPLCTLSRLDELLAGGGALTSD